MLLSFLKEQSAYFKNNSYVVLFYAAQFTRDCLLFLVALVLLVMLVVFICKKQMVEPTVTGRSSNKQTELTRQLQKIERKENNTVAIIMSSLLLLVHLSNFVVRVFDTFTRQWNLNFNQSCAIHKNEGCYRIHL